MGTPRILLIEDNEQNAYLARFLLEQAGMQVTRAAEGREGLRLARADKPDLILLDIQLPDIDGYEVAAEALTDDSIRTIPIVALTSFAMAGEKQRAFDLGCRGYIEKPLEPLKFVEQVRGFLSGV